MGTEPEPWITTPIEDRYAAGMRIARDVRETRARLAGRAAVRLARQLAAPRPAGPAPDVPELVRWSVRGEPRDREHFGGPHPADFPGGLPPAREYPGN